MIPQLQDASRIAAVLNLPCLYIVHAADPLRMLSEQEHKVVAGTVDDGTIAFTSAVQDLAFKDGYLRYEWRGRGPCVVFRHAPIGMTKAEVNGILVHEVGHWIADSNQPWRDDTNSARAVETFWKTLDKRNGHGRRWLRATIHAWSRINAAGIEVPLQNTILSFEQYRYSREDLSPLLAEASSRRSEPIEKILDSPYPGSQKNSANNRKSTRNNNPRRRRSSVQFTNGCIVRTTAGKTKIDGKAVSENEYRQFLRGEREGRGLSVPLVQQLQPQF